MYRRHVISCLIGAILVAILSVLGSLFTFSKAP
jgi:hypothetical protein